jgi:hypothetical protein
MRTVKTPVKKTRSLRAAGESVKQEPAGNREEVLLQPHTTGLESGGFSRPEDVKIPAALALATVTAATKVATGIFAARRDGVARRGQLRAGTALIARGEFSLIIIGLIGPSIAEVAALATAYVFIMAIAGPVLARCTGGPLPAGVGRGN